jgi:DNA uptake protein ComE-like DNA-binding protein
MRKSITNKGTKWEMMNSLWMLWTWFPFGFFNYISFFYVAYRVKQRKWFISGVLYSLPFILFIVVSEKHWLSDSAFIILLLSWIASIVHAFKIRAEYLLRLEARGLQKTRELEQLKTSIQKEYGAFSRPSISETVKQEDSVKPTEPHGVSRPVDINAAAEEEIAAIPAIGGLLAKKVVAVREKEGGFRSLEHFAECLQLKPHVIEKIRPFVQFPETEAAPKQSKHEGRVVDF